MYWSDLGRKSRKKEKDWQQLLAQVPIFFFLKKERVKGNKREKQKSIYLMFAKCHPPLHYT